MTEPNTKIPAWETLLDAIENKMLDLAAQRDNALALLEHCQRELALALVKIEELEGSLLRVQRKWKETE